MMPREGPPGQGRGRRRTLRREIAYRGEIFDVFRDEVALPNGHRADLELIEHPGAAAVVPFEDGETVLLIHQYRHAAEGFIWEVPAGKLDGETPRECAARELAEEVGRRAGQLIELATIWTTPGFTDERITLFAAFELTAVPVRRERDEVIEVVPTPLAEAVARVWRGEIDDAKSALALLYAARHLQRLG